MSMHAATVFIGIGSNLGDKLKQCRLAVDRMDASRGCRVEAVSPFFQSEPVGVTGQDVYVNGVARLSVGIPPRELLRTLLAIEGDMGRVRTRKWDARPIDLDILLFGDTVVEEEDLRIPHPLMHTRRFVLAPLFLLAPRLVHPVMGETMGELLARIPDGEQPIWALGE